MRPTKSANKEREGKLDQRQPMSVNARSNAIIQSSSKLIEGEEESSILERLQVEKSQFARFESNYSLKDWLKGGKVAD